MKLLKVRKTLLLPINNEMIFKVRYEKSESRKEQYDAKLEVSDIGWPEKRSVALCDVSQIMCRESAPKPSINKLVEMVFARRMVESVEVRFSWNDRRLHAR